ncbi:MAG: DUF427 domain-containing protein [Rhodobiaceae bacterium]|nr:DUF427 domain-containing protein [Rhodobiaceae bacterium]
MNPDANNRAIRIVPFAGRVTIHLGGRMVGDSIGALVLHEAGRAPEYYLPRADVRLDLALRAAHVSHSPGKGKAGYFSFDFAGQAGQNIAWSYEDPPPGAAAIKGFVAFYRDKVAITVAAD